MDYKTSKKYHKKMIELSLIVYIIHIKHYLPLGRKLNFFTSSSVLCTNSKCLANCV